MTLVEKLAIVTEYDGYKSIKCDIPEWEVWHKEWSKEDKVRHCNGKCSKLLIDGKFSLVCTQEYHKEWSYQIPLFSKWYNSLDIDFRLVGYYDNIINEYLVAIKDDNVLKGFNILFAAITSK